MEEIAALLDEAVEAEAILCPPFHHLRPGEEAASTRAAAGTTNESRSRPKSRFIPGVKVKSRLRRRRRGGEIVTKIRLTKTTESIS